jgi:hypothetical protein
VLSQLSRRLELGQVSREAKAAIKKLELRDQAA